MTRFSRPVMAGSTAANWPASPITARTRSGWRAASMPATRRRPPSGRSRVATARTRVDLPAPFGPSTAVTWPDGATRSSPASASTCCFPEPKALASPSASMTLPCAVDLCGHAAIFRPEVATL